MKDRAVDTTQANPTPPQIDLLINGAKALALVFPKGHAPATPKGWTRAALSWAIVQDQVVIQDSGRTIGLLPLDSQPHLASGRSALLVEWDADAQQPVEKGTATLTAG